MMKDGRRNGTPDGNPTRCLRCRWIGGCHQAIPSALSSLVLKLMARVPEDRVQSARELAKQLAELG